MYREVNQFFVQRDIAWDKYSVYLTRKEGSKVFVAAPVVYAEIAPGEYRDPIVRLEPEEAQQLMDELWDAGLRPDGAKGSVGQLEAIKYHLEDMRKLALK